MVAVGLLLFPAIVLAQNAQEKNDTEGLTEITLEDIMRMGNWQTCTTLDSTEKARAKWGYFTELEDISLSMFLVYDSYYQAGFAEFIMVVYWDKITGKIKNMKIIAGWFRPYTPEQQGFVYKEEARIEDLSVIGPGDLENDRYFLTKKLEEGQVLTWEIGFDVNANPALIFILKKRGAQNPDGSFEVTEEVIQTINIIEFVKKNLLDSQPPQ